MTCNICGTELHSDTKFCPQCGSPVSRTMIPAPIAVPLAQRKPPTNKKRVFGGLFLLAIAIFIVGLIVGTSSSSDSNTVPNVSKSSQLSESSNADAPPPLPAPSVDSAPIAPSFSGITLHPYDLLKNPYQSKGKLIELDLNSLPVLYNGSVIQYSGPVDPAIGTRLGLMALQLDRMAAADIALYNIMGIEAGGSNGQMLGQIAVVLPDGVSELKLDKAWMVEPLDPLKGTNYLGAEIQIPSVRFWRYADAGGEATGSSSGIVSSENDLHNEQNQPNDWQPKGPPPPPGPDAQRLAVLGLKGGMAKQEVFNLLANAGFAKNGCEDKGNGYQWCTSVRGSGEEVKTVFFRDELERIDYTFPDSEYADLRKKYLSAYSHAKELQNGSGLTWGSMAGGADLTLAESVGRTHAYAVLNFHGGLAEQYMEHLAQVAAQSAQSPTH